MYILKGVRKGTKKGTWVKIGVNIPRERTKQGKEKRRSDYYGK